MNIRKLQKGETLTVYLEGSLNTLSAPELEKELKEDISSAEEVILDMEKLEYVSSAGLRVLITAYKQRGTDCRLRLVNVRPGVLEVFKITGLNRVFSIE